MKNRIAIFMTAMVALAGLVITAGSLLATPQDEVRVALMYEPSTVNILEMKTGIDLPVILHLHEALIGTNPESGERWLTNSLSESIEVLPNNKSIKFRIRKNAIFHTGDPVTAHDVQFTYEQVAHPKNANLMAGAVDEIEEFEIIDDHNFIMHLYEPYAGWEELLWIGIASKKYFEKVGRKKFRKHPIGSGPFKFVERKSGEYVTLERFDRHPFWRTEFKTLKFLVVPDEVARLAMLETGELDLVSDILPHNVGRLQQNRQVVVRTESRVPSLYGISVKPDNYPIFKDPNVGFAMRYGINRQEIIDRVFLGEGYILNNYASKSELGYDKDIRYEYSLERARQYLKKSVYKPGDPVILSYTSAVPNARMIATMVQRYLIQVGFTIKLQQLEAGVQATYARERDPREGHMTLYAWGGGRDPSLRLLLSIRSDSIYSAWQNRPSRKELDALVDAQAKEMNKTKRRKLLQQLHQLLADEPGGVVLFGSNMIYAHSKRIDYRWLPKTSYTFNLHRIKMAK